MHGLAKLNHGKDDTVPDIANDVIVGDDVIIMEEVEEIKKELTADAANRGRLVCLFFS